MAAIARSPAMRRAALALPAVLVVLVFMVLPLLIMVYVSFLERQFRGGVDWTTFTTESYVRFVYERNLMDELEFTTSYLRIFGRSFLLAFITMALSLLVGFPTAMFMATRSEKQRNLWVFLVTVPFWTNLLIRNYAWILLLRDGGLINTALIWIGVIDQPIQMLHTQFAVSVGLTYSFLPFMILPIYSSLEKMDWRLVEASLDLYAGRLRTLRKVILPLAMPGMIAGSVLVFVPALGSFVTPELLGGGKTLMIGNLIGLQFGSARNWPFGAALGLLLLAIVLIAMMLYAIKTRSRDPRPAAAGAGT